LFAEHLIQQVLQSATSQDQNMALKSQNKHSLKSDGLFFILNYKKGWI